MKRWLSVLLAAAGCLCVSGGVSAQMGGMNFFSKPNIADIFKPVVGSGAVYHQQFTDEKSPAYEMEMVIVGKEMTPSGEGYWMEVTHNDAKQSAIVYTKMLVTKDFQFTKIVFQRPGQPAMEMPFNGNDMGKNRMKDEMAKWQQVGSETITVPAGTFSCSHWKKEDGTEEVWTNDKVTPVAMVKQVGSKNSMVLTKLISGATDHITGPVTPFDPKAFMQQRQKPQ
jgi:hypothetical protein